MRKLLLTCTTLLSATLAMGQTSGLLVRQKTTGSLGVSAGQTIRLSAFYPRSLAPIAQANCFVTLTIADSHGNILALLNPTLVGGSQTVSLDVNHDIALTRDGRVDVRGISTAQSCNLVTSMELIDNASQKTVVVVGSEVTFDTTSIPVVASAPTGVIVTTSQQ